jgi:hypothetical protein
MIKQQPGPSSQYVQSAGPLVLVDLLRTYSNHVAVLSELISAVDRLQSMDPAESSVVLSVQSESLLVNGYAAC